MPTDNPTYQQALKYHAREDRRHDSRLPLQAGVTGSAGLKVTTNGAGLQVSVAAGDAWIQGSHAGVVRQGLYSTRLDAAEVWTATAAHATLPRIDSLVLRIRDTEPAPATAGDGANSGVIELLTGTATAGATLANRNGFPTLPASSLLLADLLVPATFAGPFVNATHIRDRRPFSAGNRAYASSTAANPTFPLVGAFGTVFAERLEVGASSSSAGNALLMVTAVVPIQAGAAGVNVVHTLRPVVNGALVGIPYEWQAYANNAVGGVAWSQIVAAPVGSNVFGIGYYASSATGVIRSSTHGTTMYIEEIVSPDTVAFVGGPNSGA